MDGSTPGLPVRHQLPECAQTHVHRVSDAMQPSHPLCPLLLPPSIFPSIRVFSNVSPSHQVAKILEFQLYYQVLPINIQDWFPLGVTGWISLLSKGLSRAFSSTTVQSHQFFSAPPFLLSSSHIRTWLLEKPYLWLYGHLSAKWCLWVHLLKIYLAAPGLTWGMQDLVSWQGIKPGPPASGVQSLNHRTTK